MLQRGHVYGRRRSVREGSLRRVRLHGCLGRSVRSARCIRGVRRIHPTIESSCNRAAAAARTKTARAKSPAPGCEVADLQGEIDLSRVRGDLYFTPLRRETEHGDVDGPSSGRQVRELEFAVRIRQRAENALALCRAHGRPRQRLTFGLHHARLRQRSRKRAQKHNDYRKRPHVHCFDVREQPSGYIPGCNNKARE